jgi:hypothetical protein
VFGVKMLTSYVSYQIEKRIGNGWIKVRDFDGYCDYGFLEFTTFENAKYYVDNKRNTNTKLRILKVQTNITVLDSTGKPE